MSNHIVVDLNKVQFASFGYRTSDGQHYRHKKPKTPTLFGLNLDPKLKLFDSHGETVLSRATRLGRLDVWIPELRLQLTANHSLPYTGKKAISIWKEWNRRIFKKKGKQ